MGKYTFLEFMTRKSGFAKWVPGALAGLVLALALTAVQNTALVQNVEGD